MQHRNITRNEQPQPAEPIDRTEMAYRLVRRFRDGEQLPAHYAQFVPYCLEIVALDERVRQAESTVTQLVAERRTLEPTI